VAAGLEADAVHGRVDLAGAAEDLLERSADVLTGLATALVLGYGTFLALRHEITPGDLIVFLSYLKNAFRPLRDFAKYSGRLAKAAAAGERAASS